MGDGEAAIHQGKGGRMLAHGMAGQAEPALYIIAQVRRIEQMFHWVERSYLQKMRYIAIIRLDNRQVVLYSAVNDITIYRDNTTRLASLRRQPSAAEDAGLLNPIR
jgi:hypothetical protein